MNNNLMLLIFIVSALFCLPIYGKKISGEIDPKLNVQNQTASFSQSRTCLDFERSEYFKKCAAQTLSKVLNRDTLSKSEMEHVLLCISDPSTSKKDRYYINRHKRAFVDTINPMNYIQNPITLLIGASTQVASKYLCTLMTKLQDSANSKNSTLMSKAPAAVKDAVTVLKDFFCSFTPVSTEGTLANAPYYDFSESSNENEYDYESQVSRGTRSICSSISRSIILSLFLFFLLIWQVA